MYSTMERHNFVKVMHNLLMKHLIATQQLKRNNLKMSKVRFILFYILFKIADVGKMCTYKDVYGKCLFFPSTCDNLAQACQVKKASFGHGEELAQEHQEGDGGEDHSKDHQSLDGLKPIWRKGTGTC